MEFNDLIEEWFEQEMLKPTNEINHEKQKVIIYLIIILQSKDEIEKYLLSEKLNNFERLKLMLNGDVVFILLIL